MSMVRNFFFLVSVTVFALVSTLLAIYNYNPFVSDKSVFVNFYTSLLVGIGGFLAILIFAIKIRLNKNQTNSAHFWPSVRQGLFISFALSILLFLRGLKILDFLVGGSVIIVIILLELFFQTKKQSKVN